MSSDAVPLDCAKSIPLDVVDDFKGNVQKRKHSTPEEAIEKMSKKP